MENEMGFQVYGCKNDFPDQMPELLDGLGASVARVAMETSRHKAFAFRLTRGLGTVKISGGEEDGEMTFFVVWGRNFNPFTWWSSSRLSRDVEEKLVKAGARPLWLEEQKE